MAKPFLFAEDETARFDPRNIRAVDASAIAGYSEIVRANDIDKADALTFREAHKSSKVVKTKEDAFRAVGAKPERLPVEFAWLRVNGPGGAQSPTADAEIDSYTADQGFRLCTKEDFDALSDAYGYRFNSQRWHVAEDGSIRRGYDVALFFRSGDVARMWERYLAEEAAKAERSKLPAELRAGAERAETFSEEAHEEVYITH